MLTAIILFCHTRRDYGIPLGCQRQYQDNTLSPNLVL